MTIQELKNRDGYDFECSLSKELADIHNYDEWGVAGIWLSGEIGVEYNFCIDNGCNSSAIYKMELNKETDFWETDTGIFNHYEIDFSDDEWKEKLEDAMCKALIEFFDI